jgi:ParB family chromosome partitioning protein
VSPQLSAYALEAVADDLKTSRAWQAVQQAKEAWQARLPEQQGEWFGWLIGLSQAELIDLLALCSALTVNALPGAGAAASANALAAALGLDMADWWEPTAEGYLNHVPKAQIVAALKEAGPDLAGGGVEAMKKDALVTAAASRLAGKRWLPEPLRRSPAKLTGRVGGVNPPARFGSEESCGCWLLANPGRTRLTGPAGACSRPSMQSCGRCCGCC